MPGDVTDPDSLTAALKDAGELQLHPASLAGLPGVSMHISMRGAGMHDKLPVVWLLSAPPFLSCAASVIFAASGRGFWSAKPVDYQVSPLSVCPLRVSQRGRV